jgi:hypothetical protein
VTPGELAATRGRAAHHEIRRVRWRALLILLTLVVAVDLVSSFAWSRYRGPEPWLPQRSASSEVSPAGR